MSLESLSIDEKDFEERTELDISFWMSQDSKENICKIIDRLAEKENLSSLSLDLKNEALHADSMLVQVDKIASRKVPLNRFVLNVKKCKLNGTHLATLSKILTKIPKISSLFVDLSINEFFEVVDTTKDNHTDIIKNSPAIKFIDRIVSIPGLSYLGLNYSFTLAESPYTSAIVESICQNKHLICVSLNVWGNEQTAANVESIIPQLAKIPDLRGIDLDLKGTKTKQESLSKILKQALEIENLNSLAIDMRGTNCSLASSKREVQKLKRTLLHLINITLLF